MNEKVEQYLNEFIPIAEKQMDENDLFQRVYTFLPQFFTRDKLENAEWEDFQQLRQHTFCFSQVALAGANAFGRPSHPIEHYRKSFIYLLFGKGDTRELQGDGIIERTQEVMSHPEYQIRYLGESFYSEILFFLFPEQFALFNYRSLWALKFLKFDVNFTKGVSFADKMKLFFEQLAPLRERYTALADGSRKYPLSIELDHFFCYLYEKYKDSVMNKKVYKYSIRDNPRTWEQILEEGTIDYRLGALGDLRQFKSEDDIGTEISKLFSIKRSGEPLVDPMAVNIFHFWRSKVGEIVIANEKEDKILGIGVIAGDYEFDPARDFSKDKDIDERFHVKKVKWIINESQKVDGLKLPPGTFNTLQSYDKIKKAYLKANPSLELKFQEIEEYRPEETRYWWLNFNPSFYNLTNMNINNTVTFSTYTDTGTKRRLYEHFQAIKAGDKVIGYITTPELRTDSELEVVGVLRDKGEVVEIELAKKKVFGNIMTWNEFVNHPLLKNSEPAKNNQGTLFALTEEEYDVLMEILDGKNVGGEGDDSYFLKEFLEEAFMDKDKALNMLALLERKKNILLQGPPGVGKTFLAKRLAYLMMGVKSNSHICMVQFHPSYSYEDFVQGYRPSTDKSFQLNDGIFFKFCKRAGQFPEQKFFFIIDEINRGNLSKIFGELFMLIEHDKRGKEFAMPLTYSLVDEDTFHIPENVYLIGTMNTADRSIALVDYALRRRFAFLNLEPAFEHATFARVLKESGLSDSWIERIRTRMLKLNGEIRGDTHNLGRGYCIGHSFFCPKGKVEDVEAWYREVVRFEILPLLEEYWVDEPERIENWKQVLEALP